MDRILDKLWKGWRRSSRRKKNSTLHRLGSKQALLWWLTLAIFGLAVLQVRWGLGVSLFAGPESVEAECLASDVEIAPKTDLPASPKVLPANETAARLAPADQAPKLVLSTGFPAEQPAAEKPVASGPEIAAPVQKQPLPSPEELSELPLKQSALPLASPMHESASQESPLHDLPLNESPLPTASLPMETELASPLQPQEALLEMSPLPPVQNAAGKPVENAGPRESPLLISEAGAERSDRMEQAARQADRQIRHGFELAGRGAYFAARAEFIGALRQVAEGLDAERKVNVHGSAMASALTAIREADDFLPGGSRLETDVELSPIIAAHATPVLKGHLESMTPMAAMRSYLTFAQEQFAVAAGREVAGSMALHALGKLHHALAGKKGGLIAGAEAKAMVYYQAAMMVYPQNYMAANDLGVLLAQCGEFDGSRAMLEHSLALSQQPDAWSNVAVVYQQQGQKALADQALRQSAALRQAELARRQMKSPSAAGSAVDWVDPSTFAKTSTNVPSSPGKSTSPGRTAGLPVEPGRASPAGTVAGTANRPASTPNASPDAAWPAPTPAAAQRTMRESPAYQR